MLRLIIFGCFGLLVFLKFRLELRRPESHGFYMFFAFEALLVLGYLNIQLSGTFNGLRILSVILLICSGLMAFSGFYGLKKYGRPGKDWEDTTRLIQQGIFRWIRHPLYASLMLLALGLLLNRLSSGAILAFGVAFVSLFLASRIEEKENMKKFGDDYRVYQGKSNGKGFAANFIVSQCIGISICGVILAGHFAVDTSSRLKHFLMILVAMSIGAVLGSLLGAGIAGFPLKAVFQGKAALLFQLISIGILFGAIITYFFFSQTQISETRSRCRVSGLNGLTVKKIHFGFRH